MSINGHLMFEANFCRHLPSRKEVAILDIGCGSGDFLAYLEKRGYSNLTGIELNPICADVSRQRTSARIETIAALDTYLSSKKGRYDLIIMKSVIAHFPRERLFPYLQAIREALADTGRLIVETYNASRWTGSYLLYNDLTHCWAFTEYSLRNALEATGFQVLSLSGEAVPVTGLLNLLWRVLQWSWISCLKMIYFAERGRDRNPHIFTKYLIAVCAPRSRREGALSV